jgi:hypothetical protein
VSAEITAEALQRWTQERLRELDEERRKELEMLPRVALEWVALVPAWTAQLAEAVRLPSEPYSPQTLLERLHELRLCDRERRAVDVTITGGGLSVSPPHDVYAMSDAQRRQVLVDAVAERGRDELTAAMRKVADALRAAREPLPPRVERWTEIATFAPDEDAMLDQLQKRIMPLLDARRLGEALQWMDIARLIEIPIAAGFSAGTERLARRIELEHRRRDDDARVKRFFRREVQVEAFHALMTDKRTWALHYVGETGAGKTMILRYIAATLAPRLKPKPAVTARVDFDWLPPEYPHTEPGRLLAAFADELRLYDDTGAAAGLFDRFDKAERNARGRRRRADATAPVSDQGALIPSPGAAATRSGRRPAATLTGAGKLAATFAEAILALDRPVVLLIDTCEELAKLRSDGSLPDSVAGTFALLEEVHDLVPSLRVVFCGRRSLASGGADGAWASIGSPQPPRPYLQLHEVRGFTRDEADAFLAPRNVPADLLAEILQRTGKVDDARRFEFRGGGPDVGVARHNPFELDLYADWACDPDNRPDVKTIRSATVDPLVEIRILRPIVNKDVQELVRLAGFLGRFDEPAVRALTNLAPEAFGVAYRELLEQEWVEPQGGGFYAVQHGDRVRLRRYLENNGGAAYAQTTARVAERLPAFLEARPLVALDSSHLEAIVRAYDNDPGGAWKAWSTLEARFAAEEEWARADRLTDQLLAERGAATPQAELHGAVRATYASARAHVTPSDELEKEWAEVEKWLADRPNAPGAPALRLRAVAGRCAAPRYGSRAVQPDELARLEEALETDGPVLDEPTAACVTAAVEVAIEVAEHGDHTLVRPAARLADRIAVQDLSPELAAFALTLRARALLLTNERDQAWSEFAAAAARCPPGPSAQRWLGWITPDDVGSRVRLEIVRACYPLPQTLALVDAGTDTATAEGRWLAGTTAALRLAVAPPAEEELDALSVDPAAALVDRPRANVHYTSPPPFASAAAALLAGGRVAAARDQLERGRRSGLADAETEPVSEAAAELFGLTAIRRMRLRDEGEDRRAGRQGAGYAEQSILWTLDGLDGAKSPSLWAPDQPTEQPHVGSGWAYWRHARWRGIYAGTPHRGEDAVAWAAASLSHEQYGGTDGGFGALSCALDAVEANQLAERLGLPEPCRLPDAADVLAGAQHLHANGQSTAALRLLVRAAGLAQPGADWAWHAEQLAQPVGIRRAALIALDEGELVALRLPDAARPMLGIAAAWFDAIGDAIGTVLSLCCLALTPQEEAGGADAALRARLEQAYRDMLRTRSTLALPSWEALEALAADSRLDQLDRLHPVEWRPWLVRLLIALCRLDRREPPVALQGWIVDRYALHGAIVSATTEAVTSAGDGQHGAPLPAELDAWLAPTASPAKPPRRRSATARAVGLNVAVAVGFLLIGGAIGWTLATLFDVARPLLLVLLGVAVLYALWRWVRREVLARSTLFVDVFPLESPRSEDEAPTSVYRVRLTGVGPRVPTRRLGSPVRGVSAESRVRLDRVSGRFEPGALGPLYVHLADVARRLGRRRITTVLALGPTVAWAPWEWMIARATGDLPAAVSPFRFTRLSMRAGPPPRASSGRTQVRAFVPGVAELDLTRAWQTLPEGRFGLAPISRLQHLAEAGAGEVDADIVHLVGGFTEGLSAVGLVVAGRSKRHSELLRPDELLLRCPSARLCIVQATPVPRTQRTAKEREQAALARVFAADLADLGVPAVLTVPPLSGRRARRALEAIVERVEVEGATVARRRLAEMGDAVRKAIVEPDGATTETAFDVAVFDGSEPWWSISLLLGVGFDPIMTQHVYKGG